MHEGERFGRALCSVQSRVGRRKGPHAHRSAKSVAVAREAALHDDVWLHSSRLHLSHTY